jgi:hypothetical protein
MKIYHPSLDLWTLNLFPYELHGFLANCHMEIPKNSNLMTGVALRAPHIHKNFNY